VGAGRGWGVAFGGRIAGKNLQLKRVKKFGSFRDYKELAKVRAYNTVSRL
jgi:hypothetical protein